MKRRFSVNWELGIEKLIDKISFFFTYKVTLEEFEGCGSSRINIVRRKLNLV